MTVIVRRVHPDDWRDWRLLRQRSLTEDPDAFASSVAMWTGPNDTEERWRARIADGACFIAYDDDSPVGMVAGKTDAEGANELISMWVAPEVRRRGIGTELIEEVIAWNGDQPLSLRVIDGNTAAISAYESHGFAMLDCDADDEGCRKMVRTDSLRGVRT
jgi:GNAT superfamily N-acetyltransferase